jgi:hypothetical protein
MMMTDGLNLVKVYVSEFFSQITLAPLQNLQNQTPLTYTLYLFVTLSNSVGLF